MATAAETDFNVPLSEVTLEQTLPGDLRATATFIGRVYRPDVGGASVVTLDKQSHLIDITPFVLTSSILFNQTDVLATIQNAREHGENIGSIEEVLFNVNHRDSKIPHFLAPTDLQPAFGAGVTFVNSLLERIVAAHPDRTDLRAGLMTIIGDDLQAIKPGDEKALAVVAYLQKEGIHDDYVQPAFGEYAEIFPKALPMGAVGPGQIGARPDARETGSEPELVLIINRQGQIVGCTVGNDFSCRSFEDLSHLHLPRAKENIAAAAMAPLIRVEDQRFDLEQAKALTLALEIKGLDGFWFNAPYSMNSISRPPEELVRQLFVCHEFGSGVALYCGAGRVPTVNRKDPHRQPIGNEFTHESRDITIVRCPQLCTLTNVVTPTDRIRPGHSSVSSPEGLWSNLIMRELVRPSVLRKLRL